MHHCNNCFYANRDPETGEHKPVLEGDVFSMAAPGEAVESIEVVKSCGKGQAYWRMDGPFGHNCPVFLEKNDGEKNLTKAQARAEMAFARDFSCRTKRFAMPDKINFFDAVVVMTEDSKVAYEFFIDLYAYAGEDILDIMSKLNDMNIRGRQIDAIRDHVEIRALHNDPYPIFLETFKKNPQYFVDYVNKYAENKDVEEAVLRGASKHAHIVPDSSDNVTKPDPTGRPNRTRRLVRSTIKTEWTRTSN